MKILAIETSCDETALAILEVKDKKIKILASIVSSQVKLHAKYGGVYPMLAKREHQRNLPIVLKKALKGAKLLLKEIDLITVTVGPGLEPCLWTGVNFAKDLAKKWKKPIVPVNHIEGHIIANFVRSNFQQFGPEQFGPELTAEGLTAEGFSITQAKRRVKDEGKLRRRQTSSTFNFQKLFPAVCLVVSGGHTQLILMKDIGKYKVIGETRDDAAGECFDKAARILGLGYPGGPAVANQASKPNKTSRGRASTSFSVSLPRPMIYQKNYDFSFSGLKTAVLYDFKNRAPKIRKSKQYIQEMAAEIQQAIIDVLIKKTIKAAKDHKAKSIILSGGVAANKELRKQLANKIKNDLPDTRYLKPEIKFCTDNAVMIALTGYFNKKKKKKKSWKEIKVNANLGIG